MQVVLFEDDRVDQLAPLTMGRPAYAIGCASYRLIDLVESLGPVHVAVRDYLRGVERANGRSVVSAAELPNGAADEAFLAVNARLAPNVETLNRLRALAESAHPELAMVGETVAAAFVSQPLKQFV